MFQLAPILLFTYNRLSETKQTITSLQKNFLAAQSDLFIFSDGPKSENVRKTVQEVRNYLKEIKGFNSVTIFESEENKGLANSIISGVTQIISQFGKVIVLEDDLQTTGNFLSFLNAGLEHFEKNKEIYAINGYSPLLKNENFSSDPIYFHSRAFPWGWATWSDRWDPVFFEKNKIAERLGKDPLIMKNFIRTNGEDVKNMLLGSLNGENNSWYIRWVFSNFLLKKKSVFPLLSKVNNIGFNDSGTHCGNLSAYKSFTDFSNNHFFDFNHRLELEQFDRRFLKYFSKSYKLKYRLRLLLNQEGRNLVLNEVKSKLE